MSRRRKYFFLNHSGGFVENPLLENNFYIAKSINSKKTNCLEKFFSKTISGEKFSDASKQIGSSKDDSNTFKRNKLKKLEQTSSEKISRQTNCNRLFSNNQSKLLAYDNEDRKEKIIQRKKPSNKSLSTENLKLLLSITNHEEFVRPSNCSKDSVKKSFEIDQEILRMVPDAFTNSVGFRIQANMVFKALQHKRASQDNLDVEFLHTLFWELQRQIDFDCHERGKALSELWIERNKLDKILIQEYEIKRLEGENKSQEESQRISELCNKMIENEKSKTNSMTIELKELQKKVSYLTQEIDNRDEMVSSLGRKVNDLNRINNFLYRKLKIKIDEVNFLTLRVGKQEIEEEASESDESSEKQIDERLSFLDDADQKVENLNLIEINNLPEKPREDRLKDISTCIDEEHIKKWNQSKEVQTQLQLISKVFDPLLLNESKIKEIAEEAEIKSKIHKIVSAQASHNISSENSKSQLEENTKNEKEISDPFRFLPLEQKPNSGEFDEIKINIASELEDEAETEKGNLLEMPTRNFLSALDIKEKKSLSNIAPSQVAFQRTQEIYLKKQELRLSQNLSQTNLNIETLLNIMKFYEQEQARNRENRTTIRALIQQLEVESEECRRKKDEALVLKEENYSLIEELESLKKMLSNYKEYELWLEAHKKQKSGKSQEFINENETDDPLEKRRLTRLTTQRLKMAPSKSISNENVHMDIKRKNVGKFIIEKLKLKKIANFRNFMHIKIIMKTINAIYNDKINSTKENKMENDFPTFCYNYFLKLFGFKKITEQRFIIFILSLKKNISYFRINVFARFLGILDIPINYSSEELNKYLEALDYILNKSQLGVSITNNELETKFYVPYIRALQYTGIFGDTRMSPDENQDLKKDIENMKEVDSKGVNKAGIIDFDIFMERVLTKYRILVNRAKTYVINAFAACDLDGNRMCNMEEFLLLTKHIESERFDEDEMKLIFLDNADIENEGEKNLSFDKFSVVCVEYNLFTDEQQNKYLGIKGKSELSEKMRELMEIWKSKKYEILTRFDNITCVGEQEIDNWKTIVGVLDKKLGEKPKEIMPLLIAYKILDKESLAIQEMEKGTQRISEAEDLLKESSGSSIEELDDESQSDFSSSSNSQENNLF